MAYCGEVMSALPPQQSRVMGRIVGQNGPRDSDSSLASKWRRLHRQAERLAMLAELSPEPLADSLADFPIVIDQSGEVQRHLAMQGIDDIEAMLRPGMAALEAMRQRKASAKVPALALWREFYKARRSVMELSQTHPA